MIIYTLVVSENSVTVHDGILPRSRLRYIAENFRVYTSGAVTPRSLAQVMYHATELCIAHHIPAITLRRFVVPQDE